MNSNISKHISFKEATFSQTAIRLGIDNIPNSIQLENMKRVALKCYEPIRVYFNIPLGISSFFRSEALNSRIGGSKTSQHCFGEAIDIDADMYKGITNKEIFDWCKANLIYDQLIAEGFDHNTNDFQWIHISYREGKNRKQSLKATFKGGKTTYEPF